MNYPHLTDIKVTIASDRLRATGLLAWVEGDYGSLHLDGITLRRTKEGRFVVSFPARLDGEGKRHPYIRPVDEMTRAEITSTVLLEFGRLDR